MSDAKQGLVSGFKKVFHIKQTAPDVTKWQPVVIQKLAELKKWISLYGDMDPAGRPNTVSDLAAANLLYKTAMDNMKANAAQGVAYARDTAIPQLIALAAKYRNLSKKTPAKRQVGQRTVDVFWTDLPGFDALPEDKQKVVVDAAAAKTADGLALYQQICHPAQNAPALPPPTAKDVTNLMWALKSKAQAKEGPYVKGALTIPNGPALRAYLDQCTEEVYRRDSSHMLEQQGKGKGQKSEERPGPGQTPRGMDFYGASAGLDADPPDLDRLLPAGMNALLYQQMQSPGGTDTLYVKLETESAYLSGSGNKKLDATSAALQTRKFDRSDISKSLKHLANLGRSQFGIASAEEDKDLKTTREKTPAEIKRLCKQIVAETTDKAAKKVLAASFGTESVWLGARKVRYPRINSFLAALEKLDAQGKLNEVLLPLLEALFEELNREFGTMKASDVDRRMGEEVILDDSEMV